MTIKVMLRSLSIAVVRQQRTDVVIWNWPSLKTTFFWLGLNVVLLVSVAPGLLRYLAHPIDASLWLLDHWPYFAGFAVLTLLGQRTRVTLKPTGVAVTYRSMWAFSETDKHDLKFFCLSSEDNWGEDDEPGDWDGGRIGRRIIGEESLNQWLGKEANRLATVTRSTDEE
jgi:hypothetical protein